MIQIIAGEKGKGKTKILIEKANTEVKAAKGSIVYLDKNNKHMYELSNKIRLINVRDYFIENQSEFIGFICGIISCDHDLQSVYLDSFLKIAYVNDENIETVFDKIEKISEQFKVDLILSISMNFEQLPERLKKNVVVTL
ncbi:twitching motility protein PilT [Mobilitalea sibirica]|uniref:Twitching motility protein PilT n=1 Tax=Mobilitalea sibirica TaxID=1462919 RepID=A0A8J7KZS7_9FIRM|nr:twitching motility protein PilT [Mobilitalea sibirica]MBH1940878.1 twitching motility protein PilT [Mobilitalea sibirica]